MPSSARQALDVDTGEAPPPPRSDHVPTPAPPPPSPAVVNARAGGHSVRTGWPLSPTPAILLAPAPGHGRLDGAAGVMVSVVERVATCTIHDSGPGTGALDNGMQHAMWWAGGPFWGGGPRRAGVACSVCGTRGNL